MKTQELVEALKKAQKTIRLSALIMWFNSIGVDYTKMSDVDMYVYYFSHTKKYVVEGEEFTLEEIKEANEFTDDDELFQMIAQLEVGHTIGEGLNMATITRIK